MLRHLKELMTRRVTASDGDIGHIEDILFDDETWNLRYFVVHTGNWFDTNKVLLAPESLQTIVTDHEKLFSTQLTRNQVKESPPLSSDLPISRQYEDRLHNYYGWNPYWDLPVYGAFGVYAYPMVDGMGTYPPTNLITPDNGDQGSLQKKIKPSNEHLRSFKEITGYVIKTRDGKIGHVADALMDEHFLRLSHLVIDTNNWLPNNDVIVDIGLVRSIDWPSNEITVNLSREQVKDSPPYDPTKMIDDNYQTAISSYYHHLSGVIHPRL